MLFTHATASRIKTYKQCAFRYFLEYVLQYPPSREGNIYSDKGSAVHVALEKWANAVLGREENAEIDWEKTLREYYEKSKLWELDQRTPDKHGKPRGFPHPVEKTCESCPWATKDGRCAIANKATEAVDGCPRPNFQDDVDLINKTLTRTDYNPLELDEDGKFKRNVIGVEHRFDMEIDGVRARGVIDLVAEEDKDTIEIIDYKTGKSMSFAKAFDDPQVRIYAKVARILWPQYKYVMVTLHYLRTRPVSVPLSEDDDKLTVQSMQRMQDRVRSDENPNRVSPSKWGFPCDWCIGYETCGNIRDKFKVGGQFRLPTLDCNFGSDGQPCYGSIYPVKDQVVNADNADQIIYACKGHTEVHGGGEYISKPDDSDTPTVRNEDNSEDVQGAN